MICRECHADLCEEYDEAKGTWTGKYWCNSVDCERAGVVMVDIEQ